MLREIMIYGFSFGFVAILVYSMLRYGSVNHTWMRITRDQVKKLKQAQLEFFRKDPGVKKQKPTGNPLYKRRLISHEGVVIYQDGVYGKFCLGSKGKYKFKRFDMISEIFPVEVENPMAKTDSVLMGLKSWKEIQIETKDYEVLLIDSRKHDFDKIIPILKRGLMGRWERLYRENEIIRGKIIEGKVGWHTLIRGRSSPVEIKREESFVELKSKPKDKSRGSLLFEEPPEVINKKARGMNILGSILAVSGILTLITLFLISFYISIPGNCFFSTSVMLITLGIVFLLLAVVLFRVAKWRYPIKVYEHGTTNFIVGTGEEIFIPFGNFKSISEGGNIFEGSYYKLEAKDPRYSVPLNKMIPNIDKHMNYIREQIGRPDLDYPMEVESLKPMMKKFEYIAYGALIILSIVLAFYMSTSAFEGMGEQFIIFGIGFFFPLITIIAIFLVAFKFITFYKKNNDKTGINLKAVGVIFMVVLAVFFFNYYYAFFVWDEDAPLIEIVQDSMPQTRIPLTILINNSQIDLNDNMVLKDNENLILHDSTLIFNCSSDKEYSIWVGENARMELINCTIHPANENFGYGFEIYGSAQIVNTSISFVWGDEDNENWDGGIEIYSDSVNLIDSTISNGKTNGILVFDCSPVIRGNTIRNCPDDGLEIHFSKAFITGNIIEDNGWGIIVWPESEVTISQNTIRNNECGVLIQSSSASIENNSFTENTDYAIDYNEDSEVKRANNYFLNNGEDIREPDSFGLLFLGGCGIIIVVMAVVFYVVLFYIQKKNFKDIEGKDGQDPFYKKTG